MGLDLSCRAAGLVTSFAPITSTMTTTMSKLTREREEELLSEIDALRGLLEEAEPFARHVAACENHDGSKFQELAESWLERAERGEK